MEDNNFLPKGFQIDEITWLKRPEKQLGAHALIGMWFTTAEAAQWVVDNGVLLGHQYIGSVEHFQIKQKRCYRCQRFGHLTFSYKEQARCGHCAGDHERQNVHQLNVMKSVEDAQVRALAPETVVYSDGAENQDHLGAAAVILDGNADIANSKQSRV
ncbi:zinc knuckle domain protein [Talaromyces pinophilus]|uniref:Zinc knuckle domain protein n=1 Tax=Talaromyces pinophilus TaxID=128442 RepID=A0A478EAI4_TALPI|nr:zinc knuckle domain protein [Talaromyces pinophilus]